MKEAMGQSEHATIVATTDVVIPALVFANTYLLSYFLLCNDKAGH